MLELVLNSFFGLFAWDLLAKEYQNHGTPKVPKNAKSPDLKRGDNCTPFQPKAASIKKKKMKVGNLKREASRICEFGFH